MTSFALAVDVGGTTLEGALVSDEGVLLDGSRTRRRTGRTADAAVLDAAIRDVVVSALAVLPAGSALVGAGIGSAGPVDLAAGVIDPVNMPSARRYPVSRTVAGVASAVLGHDVRCVLGHDGGAIAVAEAWRGATRGARMALALVVSTGIGGGFTVDGRYLPGASGNAGHLGQLRRDGGVTLEAIASGPASAAWARGQGWTGETGEDLARDATRGVRVARAAIERSAAAVGRALADVATLLDIDVVAVGGGFSRSADDYVERVQHALTASAPHAYARRTRVVRSALGDAGPLLGAAAFVLR